jgi:hypothetical protein
MLNDIICIFVVFVFNLDFTNDGLDVVVFGDVDAEEFLLLKAQY